MIERPQTVDDRLVVARARAETDAVADLAGEDLDFALVSPFGRGWKMFRRVGRRLAWFDFADDRIEALAHLFIPVFSLAVGSRPTMNVRYVQLPYPI